MTVSINAGQKSEMTKSAEGYFSCDISHLAPGEKYEFYVDGAGPLPDPASRYQPEGVHGPSEIIDPNAYQWRDADWLGIAREDLIFYELHIAAFTPEGTFRSAAEKLPYLHDLGITAVELMPLADFPGNRNWGYDGVFPFAPAHCYGKPDDLRYFVDEAHQLGMAVFVDAVYNHFGPDGAYQSFYSKHYLTKRHQTPWGDAINFDGPLSNCVRAYFVENALRWIYEYHVDGLRLDATHAIKDDSPRHILAELAAAVSGASSNLGRCVYVIAEDARNLAQQIEPTCKGGMGLAGVWADDFHHQMRRFLAGDNDGYFEEFEGTVPSIAKTVRRGWQRGSDPAGIEYFKFVYCIQNHDQIGNRALGDRLNQALDPAAYRAASTLLLLLPQTPLLFMGQEWAASTPFQYFTDHHDDLGVLISEGRRREFAHFSAFGNADIPDPQALSTFTASRLKWSELAIEPHAAVLRLYKSLLKLRRGEPALRSGGASPELRIEARDDDTLLLHRTSSHASLGLMAVIRLHGGGWVDLSDQSFNPAPLWNSEDLEFAPDSQPMQVRPDESRLAFQRAGAIIFRSVEKADL